MGVQVTQAIVNQLFTDAKMTLLNAAKDYQPQFQGLYTLERSQGEQSVYPVIAAVAAMQRLGGSPEYRDMFLKSLVIPNGKPYVDFMSIQREKIEKQASMSYLDQIAQTLGIAARALEDDKILELLQNGATTVWGPDGKNFFATDHPISPNGLASGTWQNLYTGTALTAANFETVLQDQMARVGWTNRSMNFRGGFELIVPPQLRAKAKRIVEAEYSSDPGVTTAGGNTNVNKDAARVRVCQALSNEPTVWYIAATGETVKPFVVQEWAGLEMTWQTSPDNNAAFEQEEYRAKVRRGVEGGHLDPHYITRCSA
jgi:phage major head subunit gpT-like protein